MKNAANSGAENDFHKAKPMKRPPSGDLEQPETTVARKSLVWARKTAGPLSLLNDKGRLNRLAPASL